jgi:hypothetical protein
MRAIVMEGLGKIEHHVGHARFELVHDGGHVVENRECFDAVAQSLEAFEHTGFGRLILLLERLGGKRLIRIRGMTHVEQDQNLHP